MSRSNARRGVALALCSLLAAQPGCASSAAQIRVQGAFTPELAHFFDDAVDYVEDVEGLGGRVALDWQRQIDGLARNADLIAEARIETVVQGQDSDGSRNYRMTAAISRVLRGAVPEENRVGLRVSAGQVGFNTVAGKEDRIQAGRFLLFVRWYERDSGVIGAHWHLSPRSDALVARVRTALGVDPQAPNEVIVRSGGN